MTVSVVLHVWNGEPYLAELLDSILAQTYTDFELCVLDDGSTDDTPMLLERAARGEGRIRVERQAAAGRSHLDQTFNRTVAMARHELVAIANADDVWHPRKLARQVEVFGRTPGLQICWHDATVIDGDGRWLRPTLLRHPMTTPRHGCDPRSFLTGNPIPNPTVMFDRRICNTIGPQDGGWVHDSRFWLKAALAQLAFLGLPDRLIAYRVHEASHSTSSLRSERLEAENRAMLGSMLTSTPLDAWYPEVDLTDHAARQRARRDLDRLARRRGVCVGGR